MKDSKIEWTHHTANLWIGCTEVHEGCDNCYARVLNHRWGHKNWGNEVPRRAVQKVWADLRRFQKLAAEKGEIHRVFVGSMMDIFERPKPLEKPLELPELAFNLIDTGEIRDYFFEDIVPQCPNLMFLLLTKRPSNINKYIPERWKVEPPTNVMFGTSPVNQATADKLIPQLLEVKGKHFLSCEPMLGPISLYPQDQKIARKEWNPDHAIDWVICGGESGHGKRPFNPDWARALREECGHSYITPFFMKQIDKVQPIPDDLLVRQFPTFFTAGVVV